MKKASQLITRFLAKGHNMELACLLLHNFGKHPLVINWVIDIVEQDTGWNKEDC